MGEDRPDDATARSKRRRYDLRCNDCAFSRVVEGNVDDVLDVIEAHHDEYRSDQERHIVNTELRE